MKVFKLIGWTLLILIVLSVIFVVAIGIFASSEDELELFSEKKSSLRLEKNTLSLLTFPFSSKIDQNTFDRFLSENHSISDTDFLVFQNVDENNRGFDQRKLLNNRFKDFNCWFSSTRKILVSLFPLNNIRFNIYTGSMMLSKYDAASAVKRLLPSVTDQSFSLVTLNPSIQVMEFKTADQSELFIINLDNIRTNETDKTQTAVLDYIKTALIEKLPENAHIIITGEWNYTLPGIMETGSDYENIPLDWTPSGWQWIYDEQGSGTYGLLLSENIQINRIEFYDNFEQNPFRIGLSLE